ncbi:MAG: ATP-binding protein [Gaiella sp.]
MIETHLWPLTITLGSDVCHLQDIRRSMDAWLETEGCDDETRKAIVLATHEAAANAIEHSQTNSEITVRARTDDGLIVLEVSDHGQWKHEPPDFDQRGRGLMMISRLVDELEIDADGPGTTIRMMVRRDGNDARSFV